MKCPDGWDIHDHRWLVKQEMVTEDRWLLLFLNVLDAGERDYPAGWANIMFDKWTYDGEGKRAYREFAMQDGGILELECIAMEWRKDILEGRTHEAAL